jgi:hypothetical protein
MKALFFLAVGGVLLFAAGVVLRAGAFSALLMAIGAALAIGAVVLLPLQFIPAFRRHKEAAAARRREAVAEHELAGGNVRRTLQGEVVSGHHAGTRYDHYVIGDGDNRSNRSTVAVPSSAPGEFLVQPESAITGAVQKLGMVNEFNSGDAKLDVELYFSGTTDAYVREVFGARENLDVLRALVARGYDHLEKTSTRIIASRTGDNYLGVDEVGAVVALLGKLRLPATVAGDAGASLLGKKGLYIVRGVSVALAVVGFSALFMVQPMPGGWGAFAGATLPLAAFLCAAGAVGAYFLLRGRSMSARGFVEMIILLPVIVVALFGTLALANQALDTSEAREYEVRLLRSWYTTRRNMASFHVQFESWRGRGTEEFYSVDQSVSAIARAGQIWKLRVREGSLSYPWVETMAPTAR